MTYAGLKSMIYAGLTPDDPRVKAAYDVHHRRTTSLDENPGLGQRGLYYYYQTFAKALALVGKPTLVDASGKSHDWRAELTAALATRQGRTAAGSTRPTASWKATPTWSPPTASWPWPTPGPRGEAPVTRHEVVPRNRDTKFCRQLYRSSFGRFGLGRVRFGFGKRNRFAICEKQDGPILPEGGMPHQPDSRFWAESKLDG